MPAPQTPKPAPIKQITAFITVIEDEINDDVSTFPAADTLIILNAKIIIAENKTAIAFLTFLVCVVFILFLFFVFIFISYLIVYIYIFQPECLGEFLPHDFVFVTHIFQH